MGVLGPICRGPQNWLWDRHPPSCSSALHPPRKLLCRSLFEPLHLDSGDGRPNLLLKLMLPHSTLENKEDVESSRDKMNVLNCSKCLDNQSYVPVKH